MKFKIEYNRKKCIGAGTCAAVAPDQWEIETSGKARMKGDFVLNPQTQFFERIIEEKDFDSNKKAADGCPKKVIHITNIETGEKIV